MASSSHLQPHTFSEHLISIKVLSSLLTVATIQNNATFLLQEVVFFKMSMESLMKEL